MKIYKTLLCVSLTVIIGLASSTPIRAGRMDIISNIPHTEADTPIVTAINPITINDGIFVIPPYNCDPRMLVPADPNIDPGFLIEHLEPNR